MKKQEGHVEGVHKVVFLYDLEKETASGWQLVKIIEAPEVTTTTEREELVPAGAVMNNYGSTPKDVRHTQRVLVVNHKKALLFKSERAFIAEARQRCAELDADIRKKWEELREAETKRKEAEQQVAALTTKVAEANKTRDTFDAALSDARKQNRKLETDIAKIRNGIGELRMKEILA